MTQPLPTVPPFLGTGGIPVGQVSGSAQEWHRFSLLGIKSPGTIPKGGVRGFRRETGWDKQAGKGTQGATLILKTRPPCEGSIICQLFTTQDFVDYDSFVQRAAGLDPTKQKAEGLPIYYPGFSGIGLTRVVVEYYTGPEHQGKGLYNVEFKLIEWNKPPPVSIVKPITTTAPDLPSAGVPLDPRIQAAQDDVAEALLERGPEQ